MVFTSTFESILKFATDSSTDKPYELLLPLALILVVAKLFGLLAQKIHLPAIVGYLFGGILLGFLAFIPGQPFFTDYTDNGISLLAKIGVILIMFSAGVETDLKSIKAVGWASVVITSLGVLVPMGLGFLVAWIFMPGNPILDNVYYGVILSATSVSITVAVLKELGRLNSPVGSAIVSAAILDDIIGVILISVVVSLNGGATTGAYSSNSAVNVIIILLLMVGFFALSFLVGFGIKKIFNWMGNKWPKHRRISVFALVVCFIMSYLAEQYFHIADITGAYVAGLIFSSVKSQDYIDHSTDSLGGIFFEPIFFVSISLNFVLAIIAGSLGFEMTFLWFGVCWVIVGLLGKVIGAGVGARIMGFKFKDSLRIGVGMMVRAEVIIVCEQKGVEAGLVDPQILAFTLVLIILSSFVVPVLLKLLYRNDGKPADPGAPLAPSSEPSAAK